MSEWSNYCDMFSDNWKHVFSDTLQWELLKYFNKTIKRESETQWSIRIQAFSVIINGLEDIVKLLEKLAENTTTKSDTRGEATILLQNIAYQLLVPWL